MPRHKSMDDQPKPNFVRRGIRSWRRMVPGLVVLVLLGLAFFGGRYSVYRAHPELSSTEQAQALLARVSALIQLPQNETPSMATITDAASAKAQQPFLQNAVNGDILIVYSSSGEALLYRPSTNKLVAVGPISNGTPSGSSAAKAGSLQQAVTATSSNEAATTTKRK